MSNIRAFPTAIYKEWKKDEVMRHAAAIAYYTVFSLPAMLLVILSIASKFLSSDLVAQELFERMRIYTGGRIAEFLENTVHNIQSDGSESIWAALIGTTVLLIVGGGVMRELRTSLNKIFNTKPQKLPLLHRIWNYILSIILVIFTAAVLIGSIISGSVLGIINRQFAEFVVVPIDTLSIINNAVTYASITILFFLLYLFLPSRRYPPLIVLLSAVIASALLVSGTVISSYYIAQASVGQAYGAAANVLILLFWIYFAANIFLIGAEIIDVTSRLEGFRPKKRKWPFRLLSKRA